MNGTQKLHPVNAVYDGLFNSASGRLVSLIDPKPEQICLTDIAKGLSHICRFGGQIDNFYSVAKHTILVWYLAPAHLKKAALLHDASEAYLGDVIKPLKVLIEDIYGPFETRFTEVIFKKYHVEIADMDAIKQYDLAASGLEHRYHRYDNQYLINLFKSIDELLITGNPYRQLLDLFTKEFGLYDD